jgi:hypothetical protein
MCIFTVGAKSISRALDELERRCFRHFSQQGQGFFEVKNQLFSTFGFSAAGLQSRNIFSVLFFGEKISPSGKYYTQTTFH